MIRNKVMVDTYGRMEGIMMEIGRMGNSMVKGNIKPIME